MKKTENCEIISGRQLLLVLLITFLMTTVVEGVTGTVDINTVYQELEGFGASNVWSSITLPQLGDAHPEIYDVIFGDLGLDILRLRNTYLYQGLGYDYIDNSAHVISDGRARTGRPLKILISSWSPEASLKSNGILGGGGNATLAKDPTDPNNSAPNYYVYTKYAKWWADSLVAWGNKGVIADYVSMQNEPDYDASWDSCRFDPCETSVASYSKAFEKVYQKLYSQMGTNIPKMLPPETAGFNGLTSYIDVLIDANHAYGFAHHLYNSSGGGSHSNPDGYINDMNSFATNYGYKPLLQTEFSRGDSVTLTWTDAMNLAVLMYNSLWYEKVSAYLYYELTYGAPKGLVSITTDSWTINPVYYAFKHYSALTDPGWRMVHTTLSGFGASNLRMTAFKSPENDKLTIVIINPSSRVIPLTLTLNGFSPSDSEVYQSTSSAYWSDISPFNPTMELPIQSITTIGLTGTFSPVFTNCDAVLAAGYGLTSDISGDCYVNYEDLEIITNNWLNNDCDWPNNYCEGADLKLRDGNVDLADFSKLAVQWLWCNAPGDSDCIPNW